MCSYFCRMKKKKGNPKTKPKTELGQKLFAVRKQMNNEQCDTWLAWFRTKRETTVVLFDSITRGDYISKDNVRLAMDALVEGRNILAALEEELKNIQ